MQEKFWPTKSGKCLLLISVLFLCALAALFWSDNRVRAGVDYSITTGTAATEPVVPQPLMVAINRAGIAELTELSGIGEVLAGRIVAWREEQGAFEKIEDIQQVNGIGPAIYEGIKDEITVD